MQDTLNTEPKEDNHNSVDNKDSNAPSPKRPIKSYLIAIAILIIALLIISVMPEGTEDTDQPVEDETTDEITIEVEGGEEGQTQIKLNMEDMSEGFSLDTFEDLDEAGLIINSSQGRPTDGDGSEILVSNVVDAGEENMVYFATMSLNKELGENFVGIYHYNTITNRWQRVYKETMEVSEGSTPLMRVLARTGDHLILLKDQITDSTDSCKNFWLEGETEGSELLIMDLNDPYAGFNIFPLPEQLKQSAQAERAECLAAIE